jgi:hypothetical protein
MLPLSDIHDDEAIFTKVGEFLSTVDASIAKAPSREIHFWIKPGDNAIVTGPRMHGELVDRHWERMGLPEDHAHSMLDAIAHGWMRVRITPETAIIHGRSLRDAQRVLTLLLDIDAVVERPFTVSIDEISTVWHKMLCKWVAVADLSKTRSYQFRGFEEAERFARGATRFAELPTSC